MAMMDGRLGDHHGTGDMLQKPNFRSCGRLSQKVQPCHAGTVRNPDSVPTIPSRIETTLYKGRREKKGFGSHSLRFDVNPSSGIDPEGPGPGAYGNQKAFHEEYTERFGWGARGTGGFASRSRRFGARSMPTMPTLGRGVPGPGQYDSLSCANKLKDASDFNQANTTAVFADPSPEVAYAKSRNFTLPGPGQYKIPSRHPSAPAVNAAVASFKSASMRGEAGPEQGDHPSTIPGPGAYYSQKPILPPTGSGTDGVNAIFREPSQRRFCPVIRDLPAADEKARKILGDFAPVVAKECVGQRPTDLPGPGQYDQDRDSMWNGRDAGRDGTSSFQIGSKRVEWAGEEEALKPGPGRYEPKSEAKMKLTSAMSAFVSLSEQHGFADLQKGPGPCYYKPGPPTPKRSFMLNSKKRWL